MKKIIWLIFLGLSLSASEKSIENVKQVSRDLLTEEMFFVESGMKEIFSGLIRNDLALVKQAASKIENSHVFSRKMTKEIQEDLTRNLPKDFFVFDQEFHELAGKLANAAEFDDRKEAMDSYIELSKKCVQCHSTYAKHKFPF